jgi:hypothetical protein
LQHSAAPAARQASKPYEYVNSWDQVEALPWWPARLRHLGCDEEWAPEDGCYDPECGSGSTGALRCPCCGDDSTGAGHGAFLAYLYPSQEVRVPEHWAPVPDWLMRAGSPLDLVERCLVLALWSYENGSQTGEAYPKIERLAADVGRSEAQVKRVLASLVDRDVVERWRPSRRERNHYSVRPFIERESAPVRPVRERTSGPSEVEAVNEVEIHPSGEASSYEPAVHQSASPSSSERSGTGVPPNGGIEGEGLEPGAVDVELREDLAGLVSEVYEPGVLDGGPPEPGRHLDEREPVLAAEADDETVALDDALEGEGSAALGAACLVGAVGAGSVHAAATSGSGYSTNLPSGAIGPDPFVGGACADPLCCDYRMRFASGSWTCEHCHPRKRARGFSPSEAAAGQDPTDR